MLAAAAAAALVLLHGTVTMGPQKRPAGDVLLEFGLRDHLAMATTDSHGRFSVRLVPGTWTVLATKGIRTIPGRIVVRHVLDQRTNFYLQTTLG